MQDIFAILFLAIQPELSQPSFTLVLKSLGKVGLLFAVAFAVSRFVLPLLFRAVARLPELVLVGALAWCFLMAGMAHALQLSSEMGALPVEDLGNIGVANARRGVEQPLFR